jgi:hypothetical protein
MEMAKDEIKCVGLNSKFSATFSVNILNMGLNRNAATRKWNTNDFMTDIYT